MAKTLLEKLRTKRADYDEELAWHRFLLDTICSSGGYKGRVGPSEISLLGWAAEAYATMSTEQLLSASAGDTRRTYLDQFPREDAKKFSARINVACFVNYTAPVLETLLAYIGKEETNYDGLSERTGEWMESVDGDGMSWETLKHEVVNPRAAGLGYCPVLFDKPALPEAYQGQELSAAQAAELGTMSPRPIPLYPMNLLDWQEDAQGRITSAKILTCHTERDDLLNDAVAKEVYSLWYADRVERYVVTKVEGQTEERVEGPEVIKHGHGCVPLVVFRAKPAAEDHVRGASVVGDTAVVNRRLFNIDSEYDDFLRNSCFPLLAIPVADMKTPVAEIVGGSGSGLKIPSESKQPLAFVAPPDSVPNAIKERRADLVRELYRVARLEFQRPTGVTSSGIARAYEFEGTNRRLGEIAQSLARGEEEALRLVTKMLGDEAAVEDTTVTAPADFSVEDMASDLANITGVTDLGVGATAETELKRRVVRRMLPNLPADKMEAVDRELDALQAQNEQDKALEREVAEASAKAIIDPPEQPVAAGGEPGQSGGEV